MNYIDQIFSRADIQQIREFLLYGVEGRINPSSYKEREDSARKRITTRLHEEYPDEEEYEKMTGLVDEYVSMVQNIYMEIGLQLGAILAAQVCQTPKAASGRG